MANPPKCVGHPDKSVVDVCGVIRVFSKRVDSARGRIASFPECNGGGMVVVKPRTKNVTIISFSVYQ
jgi:hypothetical protein